MTQITANGITLEYEDYGNPGDPPVLLVMGLGAQLTLWPMELVEAENLVRPPARSPSKSGRA